MSEKSHLPATPALASFALQKDDPKVQGLTSFILLTLHKRLGQVHVWSIAPYQSGVEDSRPFKLELLDGRQIEGTLHRLPRLDAQGKETWLVGEDWSVVF